jgi:cell division protein FtsI/penicillin-binding protein 2
MKGVFASEKKILHIIFFLFLLIIFRVWNLAFVQKDDLKNAAKRPQRKMIIQHANRGTIYDRFHKPLALNRIRHNAAIYYAHIRQIPTLRWIKDKNNKKIKIFPRREYIEKLSQFLANELKMDPIFIEDLINAKASLLPHTPFIIKENIDEKKYFKLRMLEKNWVGLHAEITSERFYPMKKVLGDTVGYLGAISQNEYFQIASEIDQLESFKKKLENKENPSLPLYFSSTKEVLDRLTQLKERAYRINDLIGKWGFSGKKVFEVNIKGNFIKELAESKKESAGKSIYLTVSSELQEFAESLLSKDEKTRDGVNHRYDSKKKISLEQKQPLIKGGAIVAIQPTNGEVLALASYPRFDPNDFIPSANPKLHQKKQKNIHKWFETSTHIANIWDGKCALTRELYSEKNKIFYEEKKELTWSYFLDLILPKNKTLHIPLEKIGNIQNSIQIQEKIEDLCYLLKEEIHVIFDFLFNEKEGHILCQNKSYTHTESLLNNFEKNSKQIEQIKNFFLSFLSSVKSNRDKLFLIDICRISVFSPAFSDDLIEKIGEMSLSDYWQISKQALILEEKIEKYIHPIFTKTVFTKWRNENQKNFLKKQRKIEREKRISPRPYTTYLEKKEKKLFKDFWDKNRLFFLSFAITENLLENDLPSYFFDSLFKYIKNQKASSFLELKETLSSMPINTLMDFFRPIRSYKDLNRPLLTKYPFIRKSSNKQIEQNLAASFYPLNGFGYGRSQAFRQSAPLGSIFKIVTSYATLRKCYPEIIEAETKGNSFNPFSMTDTVKWDSKAGKNGSIVVGYSIDNKPYPRFYKGGMLPRSSSYSVGKVNLLSAIEQSSNSYFSLLASEIIKDPQILLQAANDFGFGRKTKINIPGEIKGGLPKDLKTNRTGFYSFAIGQHSLIVTPLQTAMMLCSIANGGYILKPKIIMENNKQNLSKNKPNIDIESIIFMPSSIRTKLMEGLDRAVWGERGSARPKIISKLWKSQDLRSMYNSLEHTFIGKTSTAEIMYNPNFNPSSKADKYKHIWFSAISFENDPAIYDSSKLPLSKLWEKPELVVVVYLKFGNAGKEAAPIAAQIIKKYRDIKKNYSFLEASKSSSIGSSERS